MKEFSAQYIKMCKESQEEIKCFRISREFAKEKFPLAKSPFKKNDYFHHPDLMEKGETKIVEKIIGSDLFASDSTGSYPEDESILVPTAEQIKEMADLYNLSEDTFKLFLDDDIEAYGYSKKPRILFRTLEEQWLAHYMSGFPRKIWDFQQQKWISNE